MFFLLLLTHLYFLIGFYLDYGAKEFVPVIEVRIMEWWAVGSFCSWCGLGWIVWACQGTVFIWWSISVSKKKKCLLRLMRNFPISYCRRYFKVETLVRRSWDIEKRVKACDVSFCLFIIFICIANYISLWCQRRQEAISGKRLVWILG